MAAWMNSLYRFTRDSWYEPGSRKRIRLRSQGQTTSDQNIGNITRLLIAQRQLHRRLIGFGVGNKSLQEYVDVNCTDQTQATSVVFPMNLLT
jgi:hypothetical protein